MEFHQVNFKVIEECFQNAASKEVIFNVFTASAVKRLDSEIKVATASALPPSLQSLPVQLGVSNEKAAVLVLSLHALLKEYIAVTAVSDELAFAGRFPAEFNKSVLKFLFKMMRDVAEDHK